ATGHAAGQRAADRRRRSREARQVAGRRCAAMKPATLAPLAIALAACAGDAVSDRLDPAEYRTWHKVETYGVVPGHSGDTYRIIYASPEAETFDGGRYPEGTRLVKEIHALDTSSGKPAAGALQYVAIMRRLPGPPPAGLSDEGGWQFTYTKTPGGSETHYSYC